MTRNGRRLISFSHEDIDALPVGSAFVPDAKGQETGMCNLVKYTDGWHLDAFGEGPRPGDPPRHPLDIFMDRPAFEGSRTLRLPPTTEPRRIAEHVAEVTPQYRERAREWLNAEHADMVEELATLLATISAECCP